MTPGTPGRGAGEDRWNSSGGGGGQEGGQGERRREGRDRERETEMEADMLERYEFREAGSP